MIGKTNVGGGKQAKLAAIPRFASLGGGMDEDFGISIYNGEYADYPVTFELYRDDILLTPSTPFNIDVTDTSHDYKRELITNISLRDKGLAITGSHNYKLRAVCEGFEPTDYKTLTYTMYALTPAISIASNTLTIVSTDAYTSQYKIYADGNYRVTVNKTGNSQTFDLTTLSLAGGNHTIAVQAIGNGVTDSGYNTKNYYVSTGYNITVNLVADSSVPNMMGACIKLNSAPSSESDYDYYYSGGVGTYDSDIPASFLASKVYVWGGDGQITSPVTENLYPSHTTYNTAKEITYSADGTLGLHLYYDE